METYHIGDQVRVLVDIFEYPDEPDPGDQLAEAGDIFTIIAIDDDRDDNPIQVTNGSEGHWFRLEYTEIESAEVPE